MMRERPLVSVITIFLNEERFLSEAVESVLAQTYDRWELLLVDDGSSDASPSVAQRYVDRYPDSVRYLRHEGGRNKGMSASRNLGARHARGELLAMLDADDVWLPNKLTEQVEVMQTYPEAAMVYGRTRFWYAWANGNDQNDWLSNIGVAPESLVQPPLMLRHFLKSCPYTCSAMIRKEVFELVGGYEDAFRGMYEDQVFFAKVFTHAPVYVSGRCWDLYRQHSDSCCAAAIRNGDFHPSEPSPTGYAFLCWLREYMSEAGVDDERVWREFNDMMGPYERPVRHRIEMGLRRARRRAAKAYRRLAPSAIQ